jgi:hypothetical protein
VTWYLVACVLAWNASFGVPSLKVEGVYPEEGACHAADLGAASEGQHDLYCVRAGHESLVKAMHQCVDLQLDMMGYGPQ